MSSRPMSAQRFADLADAWGPKLQRWPAAEQAEAMALLGSDPQFDALLAQAAALEDCLGMAEAPSADLRRRVLLEAAQHWQPSAGFLRRLWAELGGLRLVAPVFAASMVLALALAPQYNFDPGGVDAEEPSELWNVALLDAEDEEYLP